MCKPSRTGWAPALARVTSFAFRLAILNLCAPLHAQAGVTASLSPQVAQVPTAAQRPMQTSPYQIRCWQNGRLLFEENQVMLPADDAQHSVRIDGTDRAGRPLLVAETKNATCLIRSTEDRR